VSDILALRTTLQALNADLASAQANLLELETELQNDGGDLPPAFLQELRRQVVAAARVVQRLSAERDAAQAAYQAAVAADPMQNIDAGLPLVLLPVRIETAAIQIW